LSKNSTNNKKTPQSTPKDSINMNRSQKVSKKATDQKANKIGQQQRRKISTKKTKKIQKSNIFKKTTAQRGLWDTPQDEPGTKPEKYVDFFKDTPVNSLAGQFVRDLRDFVLIQTGSPQFFDRDYEAQKLLGMDAWKAHKKQLADNNYAGFQDYNELDFNSQYYTRVGMIPANTIDEPELLMNPNHSLFRSVPTHQVQYHNVSDPVYLDHRDHVSRATGVSSAGPYYVPRTKFQFPYMSVDNDYLFFHD
jgi:hypothetical protein